MWHSVRDNVIYDSYDDEVPVQNAREVDEYTLGKDQMVGMDQIGMSLCASSSAACAVYEL